MGRELVGARPIIGDNAVRISDLEKGYPGYAQGVGLQNFFDAARSVYNLKSENTHSVTEACARVAAATGNMHIGFFGDSTLIGYNGSTYNYKHSIPYRFGMTLAALLGCPYPTTGLQNVMVASGAVGDRWTLTGSFSGSGLSGSVNYLISTNASGTATWVSPDPGTNIDLLVANNSTASSITVTVDGANSKTVTPTGTSTFQKVSWTGLSYGTHTVVVTTNGVCGLGAIRCWNTNVDQIHVHNLALGGSKANTSGTSGLNWSDTTTLTGLGSSQQLMMTASGITMDLMVLCVGNNDVVSSTAAATIVTGIQNIRNYWSSVPCIIVRPPRVSSSSDTIFQALQTGALQLADTLDVPLADWNSLANTTTSYSADGAAGGDGVHPIDAEEWRVGSWLANLVSRPMVALDSLVATMTRLQESGGVYPARPNLPAGAVSYIGADQPTDWLPGDSWDDLP